MDENKKMGIVMSSEITQMMADSAANQLARFCLRENLARLLKWLVT
jgi:hypothetical protein